MDATSEMRENSQRLADTLKSFGIEPHIVDVIRGPSVTRYELELDRGVKLSKITNLADDIALALGAAGVRISAIPDKVSVVGIEVPNKIVNTVYAREVIDSPAFRSSKSKILVRSRQGYQRQLHRRRHRQAAAHAHRRYDRLRQVRVHEHAHRLAAV